MEFALQGDCRGKRREIHRAARSPPPLSFLRLQSLRSVEPLWRRESPRKVVTFSFCLIFKYRHVDTRLYYAFYEIISFLK